MSMTASTSSRAESCSIPASVISPRTYSLERAHSQLRALFRYGVRVLSLAIEPIAQLAPSTAPNLIRLFQSSFSAIKHVEEPPSAQLAQQGPARVLARRTLSRASALRLDPLASLERERELAAGSKNCMSPHGSSCLDGGEERTSRRGTPARWTPRDRRRPIRARVAR